MTKGSERLRYNVATTPAFLATVPGGRVEEVSLRDLIRRAPELTSIVGEVPSQALAALRFVLAVVHRSLMGPATIEEWARWNSNWSVTAQAVSEYLDEFEDRLDLCDPDAPFLQVSDLRSAKDEVFGLERIIADVPSGNPFMTTRIGRGIERITWAEAFRWLLHAHAADPSGIKTGAVGDPRVKGGKGYPEGPGWLGQIDGMYIEGANVAETIMLNLVAFSESELGLESGDQDVPVWERKPLTSAVDDANHGQPRGLIDLYVWQARRIRLIGDVDGVTGVVLSYGDRLTPQNRQRLEPMTSWRYSEPQSKKLGGDTYMPRAYHLPRAMWRGLDALLPHVVRPTSGSKARSALPPAVVTWSAMLQRAGLLPTAVVRIRTARVEYGSQQSTYAQIVDDAIDLPAAMLADDSVASVVIDAAHLADECARLLGFLGQNLAYASGASGDAVEGPRDRLKERAYATFGDEFRDWLAEFPPNDADLKALGDEWRVRLQRSTREISADAIAQMGPGAWLGHERQGRRIDVGIADVWLQSGLSKLFPRSTTTATHDKEVVS